MARNAVFFSEKGMSSYLNFFVSGEDGASLEPDEDKINLLAFEKMRANFIKCDYDKFVWSAYNWLIF